MDSTLLPHRVSVPNACQSLTEHIPERAGRRRAGREGWEATYKSEGCLAQQRRARLAQDAMRQLPACSRSEFWTLGASGNGVHEASHDGLQLGSARFAASTCPAAVDLLPPLCPRCFSDSGCTQGEMSIMGSERSFIGGGVEGLLVLVVVLVVLVVLCRVGFVE